MSGLDNLVDQGILSTAAQLKSKQVSPVELVDAVLGRIVSRDPHCRAYLTVAADAARAAAQQAEKEILAGDYKGPLHGITYAAKDMIYTKDAPTTCGSAILKNWVPDYDATIIRRLKDSGAILIGKLVMTEFAGIGYHPSVQPPRNPWQANHWTGQSSSGSGVAAAAGLCHATLGSDTGGSLRYPASACGVVGLRPTRGRVSAYGAFPLAETLDTLGPMARRAEDVALLMSAIAGEDEHDPTTMRSPPPAIDDVLGETAQGLRIGCAEDFMASPTDPQVASAVRTAAATLEALGSRLEPVAIPMIDDAVKSWGTVFVAECLLAHRAFFPARADEYGEALRLFLEQGGAVTGADYAHTHRIRFGLRRKLEYLFDRIDVILLPTIGCLPPSLEVFPADGIIPVERAGELLRFTAPFALTGHPAISVPCGFSADGLPIGMQLVGKFGDDALLLRLAQAFQGATEWHMKSPPLKSAVSA